MTCPCSRCDLLLGLDGVHVEDVDRRDGLLIVTVSSPAAVTGCPTCGVIATGRGRRRRVLHDVSGVTRVRIVWRQRVWRSDDAGWQYRDAIVKSLKPVYTAPCEAAAKDRFEEFAAEWGERGGVKFSV